LNDALKKLLEAVGIAPEKAVAELKEIIVKFPEGSEREAAIEALIAGYAVPALADLPNTLSGIAKDIATGTTGVDPEAWAGSV
jgi:hypothetical protein